jgi:hypothetical protein
MRGCKHPLAWDSLIDSGLRAGVTLPFSVSLVRKKMDCSTIECSRTKLIEDYEESGLAIY